MNPLAISGLMSLGKEIIGRVWPNPQEQAEELRKLHELEQKGDLADLQAYVQVLQGRLSVIKAEASSEHWLAANWRPITMLTFTTMIVLRMLGFDAEAMSEAEYLKLWGLMELGLGGYVVSRGVEKCVKTWKSSP